MTVFIQKPKIPSSQKITWSSYKHWNTAKLLVGITPTGFIFFIPLLWTGSISDKEIVKESGLLNLLEEGDAVMADKGFLMRDILAFKKVYLISPAYCKGPRLPVKETMHTHCVSSLPTYVERNILKLKQFRTLSGVIPLLLKPMWDRIVFICAALTDHLCKRSILKVDIHTALLFDCSFLLILLSSIQILNGYEKLLKASRRILGTIGLQ